MPSQKRPRPRQPAKKRRNGLRQADQVCRSVVARLLDRGGPVQDGGAASQDRGRAGWRMLSRPAGPEGSGSWPVAGRPPTPGNVDISKVVGGWAGPVMTSELLTPGPPRWRHDHPCRNTCP